jgi:hypothetical protein
VITTDPSITTNAITDFGKDYRGPTDDGPFSLWGFGSTSAFDTTVGIDNFFANPANVPIAVFKFQSLSIIGNPTIDLTSGGVTKLGLIGVDGITTGPPGGTLTFTGLDTLLLATVNGPINLTSDVSFDGISLLYIYARGAGSTLTLASPILNSDNVFLASERPMDLMVGITAHDSLTFITGGDLTVTGSGQFTVDNVAKTIPSGSIALQVGGNINTVGVPLNTTLDNTGGVITNNASVIITVSGAVSVQGDATFQILNSDNGIGGPPGQIGGNATIDVSTGGDFSANSLTGFINDLHGGSIGGTALVAFNIGGALSVTTDATLGISTRNDGTGGGTIGSNASVSLNAGSVSVGSAFTAFVSTNAGGSITGNAIAQVSATGDMVVQGPIDVTIGDTGFNQINPINFIAGGHIGGNATVTLSSQNIITSSTATGIPGTDVMALEASIYTSGQGTIGGNAIVNVNASQNISAPGTVFFAVANGNFMGFGPGMIGGDAQINVSAGNLSTGALFDDIYNYGGGSIGGSAIISLNLANNFSATGNAEFLILSFGGNITQNASINVNAGAISAPSLTAGINNSSGGLIGGNALINFGVTGDIDLTGDANFQINNNAGSIGGDATIDVSAANITANSLTAQINNTDGSIGGNAIINVATSSDINTAGALNLLLENYNETANPAGHIGGSGNISVTTGGSLTADSISAVINNRDGGTIVSSASLIFSVGGALTTLSQGTDYFGSPSSLTLDLSNRYENTLGSAIGGDATLGLSADSASIGGDLNVLISNRSGTIGGNALVNFNVTNNVTITGDAAISLLNDGGSQVFSPIGGTIHGDATLQVSADNFSANSLFVENFNRNGGVIDSNASLSFNLSGNLTTAGGADFEITNQQTGSSTGLPGGSIGLAATLDISAVDISIGTDFTAQILNQRGSNAPGPSAGSIGTDATLNISAASFTVGGAFNVLINNINSGASTGSGGSIGGNALVNFNVTNGVQVGGDADFLILNHSNLADSPGGSIGGDAAINVSAASFGSNSLVTQISNNGSGGGGGLIGGSAALNFALTGDFTSVGDAYFNILNGNGGTISGGATVNVNAANISTGGLLFSQIDNPGGSIGGNANLTFSLTGGITTGTNAFFQIFTQNANIGGSAMLSVDAAGNINTQTSTDLIINNGNGNPGVIGSDAAVSLSASSISTGDFLHTVIFNDGGGSVGGNVAINVNVVNDITAQSDLGFNIENAAGTIAGDATVNVSATNITANSLLSQIDNTGGSIGGNAAINMNVSGSATVTNDATVAIYGSDGATSAAINITNVTNGSYDVGGTFLSYIDGNGTITFNNATAHANILKAGVFGANGVLNIGGGTLSADTTLQLYAPGSNGQLNFVSSVTLGGAGTKILAANSVTIFNGVVVTVSGSIANVYTNNPNYSVTYGGNGSTTGTFAGVGAITNSLDSAPPFDDPPPPATVTTTGTTTKTTSSTTSTTIKSPTLSTTNVTSVKVGGSDLKATSKKATGATINVSNTSELLSLLDGATTDRDGKIRISRSKSTSNSANSSRINANSALKTNQRMLDVRHMRDHSAIDSRPRAGVRIL